VRGTLGHSSQHANTKIGRKCISHVCRPPPRQTA
jgi:hypothetical protein